MTRASNRRQRHSPRASIDQCNELQVFCWRAVVVLENSFRLQKFKRRSFSLCVEHVSWGQYRARGLYFHTRVVECRCNAQDPTARYRTDRHTNAKETPPTTDFFGVSRILQPFSRWYVNP